MNIQTDSKSGRKSWLVDSDQAPKKALPDLALQIMNIMEQGIIVWSADGICELHNTRIFDVLELSRGDIGIGTKRSDFLAVAEKRGEFAAAAQAEATAKFKSHKPFSFDHKMPSARIVSTNARPSRGGGYVVTFTDVTEARRVAEKLAKAIEEVALSERRAHDVLENERIRQKEAVMLGQLDEWLQSCKTLDELFEIVQSFMSKFLPQTKGELLVYSNSHDVLEGACHWS